MSSDLARNLHQLPTIPAVASILDVVCRTTGMGFAAVARVTDTQWIACSVLDHIGFGLQPGDELKLESTLCNEIRQHRDPVVIDHVAESTAYCGHHTPALYGFQSYISFPITLRDGSFFGTLCAIDPRPHRLDTPETTQMFRLFAELIAFHIDAQQSLASSAESLRDAEETAALREQFIAVLGHDLRNPLAAVDAGIRVLMRTQLEPPAQRVTGLMHASVRRMAGMIDNLMDFARGRLGGGFALRRLAPVPLQPVLDQVVDELRAALPDRAIETRYALAEPIACDPARLAQMLSNLLGNALAHGAPDRPVRLEAVAADGMLTVSVANAGPPIPPETQARLFQPYVRGGDGGAPGQGLGLGLYIAAEIARAHGGTLGVESGPAETRFTFRMRCAG